MMKIAPLPRSIIKVYGKDAFKFLQGLISNDVLLLDPSNNLNNKPNLTPALYSGLFTNNGRYNFDFFVIKIADDYLIDINSNCVDALLNKLKFYTLISDVNFKLLEQLKVFAIFDESNDLEVSNFNFANLENNHSNSLSNSTHEDSHNTTNNDINNLSILFADTRLPSLGLRLINSALNDTLENFICDVIEYNYLCHSLAIVDNAFTVEKSIPLEYGFDELNAIAYNKGCYLGQEFTNSSKNRLAIRKRVVPIFIKDTNIKVNDYILAKNEDKFEKAGEIISICKDCALVLFKIKFMNNALSYNDSSATLKVPTWLKTFTIEE